MGDTAALRVNKDDYHFANYDERGLRDIGHNTKQRLHVQSAGQVFFRSVNETLPMMTDNSRVYLPQGDSNQNLPRYGSMQTYTSSEAKANI